MTDKKLGGDSSGDESEQDVSGDLRSAQRGAEGLIFRYVLLTLGEALFILLPLIVIALVTMIEGRGQELWTGPEWAFAATILFGSALFKLSTAISSLPRPSNWQFVGFVVAVVLVLGIVPSLIILTLLLENPNPRDAIIALQLVLFATGLVVFILFGTIGYILSIREAEDRGTRWLLSELDAFELEGNVFRKVEEVRRKIMPPRAR